MDREKAQLKEQFEDTINKLRQQYTDEAAQIRKTQQEDMARLSTAHRRDIKKLQSQHEAVLAELKQSHAKEVLEAKEQARTASSAAERKFDAQWKHWKKDHDIRIQELQKKLDERETTIEQLKERAVNFNRLQDKRVSRVAFGALVSITRHSTPCIRSVTCVVDVKRKLHQLEKRPLMSSKRPSPSWVRSTAGSSSVSTNSSQNIGNSRMPRANYSKACE